MGLTPGSRPTAAVAILSLAVVLALAVVACSGGGSTPTPTPAATPVPTPAASPAPTPAAMTSATASPLASLPAGSPVITGAQVCTDLAAFQASLDTLTGLDLESVRVRDVIGALQAAVTTGLAFVESVKAAFGPEAQALGTALTGLQAALQGIT
jgi:hypothetical protein